MTIDETPLRSITVADLATLVANQVVENSRIEYKQKMPISSDEEKREFLADVTAFANATGGRILIGVEARDGCAVSLPGIPKEEVDSVTMRASSILRDGVTPNITGLEMYAVDVTPIATVLIIHIPESLSRPHMVKIKGLQRFYSRTSSGKHQMEYAEIRNAFVYGESAREKLEALRSTRVQRIIAGSDFRTTDTTFPAFVMEVVPLISLQAGRQLTYDDFPTLRVELSPINSVGWDATFDFDGLVTYDWNRQANAVLSYTRLCRMGYVSAYTTSLSLRRGENPSLTSSHFEFQLSESVERYSGILRRHDLPLPHGVTISLINARGLELVTNPMLGFNHAYHPVQENYLLTPLALITEESEKPIEILRQQFDAIWNAFGYSKSINYDSTGKWAPRQ